MPQIHFSVMNKAEGYIKENWGSPFIMGFILLLGLVAAFSSTGFISSADNVVVYAFYVLVAGLFLQLASFLKYRGKCDDEVVV